MSRHRSRSRSRSYSHYYPSDSDDQSYFESPSSYPISASMPMAPPMAVPADMPVPRHHRDSRSTHSRPRAYSGHSYHPSDRQSFNHGRYDSQPYPTVPLPVAALPPIPPIPLIVQQPSPPQHQTYVGRSRGYHNGRPLYESHWEYDPQSDRVTYHDRRVYRQRPWEYDSVSPSSFLPL